MLESGGVSRKVEQRLDDCGAFFGMAETWAVHYCAGTDDALQ